VLKISDYLGRAAECRRLARSTANPHLHHDLLELAAAWEAMAEQCKQAEASKTKAAQAAEKGAAQS
jgi:hypothetical protein